MAKRDALVSLLLFPGITVLGLFCALFALAALRDPVGVAFGAGSLALAGLLFFLGAKATVIRRGVWCSFGTGPMGRAASRAYWIGYVLMISGAACGAMLAAILRIASSAPA